MAKCIEYLVCAQHCAKPLTFNLHINAVRQGPIPPPF